MLWVVVAILCIGGGGLCIWQNVMQRQDDLAWHAREQNRLLLRKGKWVGYSAGGSSSVASDPHPRPSAMFVETERIRRTIAGWNSGIAPMLWIALIVAAAVWRKKRPAILDVALGVAVVAGVAWFAHPAYTITLDGIFNNDMLLWAALMLLITSIAFWRALRAPGEGMSGPPVCSKCQYSLTGNVSGVCPECGEPTEKETASAL